MERVRRWFQRARAQSSVIGVVFILGLTLTMTSAIVVLGGAVLDDSQQESRIGQAEQALTQFDSRAAQVALGESDSQTVHLGRTGSEYRLEPDAGEVTIVHDNRTGDGNEETIHQGSLGALVYVEGDTEIAYQGGGVWRRDGGGTTMVSPPEFHYRDATLTFPIIGVTGEGASTGSVSASVAKVAPPREVFPNATDSYANEPEDPYENPIEDGTMKVTIDSEYCEGWRSYFESRTDGEVTECNDGEVTAEILSIGTQGEFEIANEPELNVRGVEDLQELTLEFRVHDQGSGQQSDFNNFEWSMSDEQGDQQFEVYIHNNGGGGVDCDDPDDSQNVTVEVYYSDDGGGNYSTWINDETHDDFDIVCEDGAEVLEVDLLSDAPMTYEDSDSYSSGGDLPEFAKDAESFEDPTTVDGRSATTGEQEEMYNLTKYYMDQMGDMDLNIREKSAAGISDDSRGMIRYEGDGRVITFLHITENEVRIELD